VSLSDDASIQEARKSFDAASRRCAYLAVRSPDALSPEEYMQARDEACADADAKEELLAKATERSPLLKNRWQERQFGVERIVAEARKLPRGSALVSFVIYERVSDESWLGAFVLDPPSGRVQFIRLEPVKTVDALVDDWRRHFNKDARDVVAYRKAATALRQAIWDKIAPELGGASTVFIVPDGKLNLVSFATLPSDGGGYLVKDKSFHYLSAERDLVTQNRVAPNGVLVVSGPAFDRAPEPLPPARTGVILAEEAVALQGSQGRDDRCLDPDPAPHSPVQESERRAQELIGIADNRGRANLQVVGPAASKPAFEALASSFRDVYVLTHAEVDEPAAADAGASPHTDDPLLRSRLLLAGADCRKWSDANHTDTGVLTAKDLAGLNLSNVSSLILHACKTGTGSEVKVDEGVLGLRRAVHTAGAGSIVMTLWEVDDLRTQPWMTDLFERRYKRERRESLVEAVNGATRDRYEALGPDAHPYWWGGFVSAGDWR
jgi:CHAT domain-containing protein